MTEPKRVARDGSSYVNAHGTPVITPPHATTVHANTATSTAATPTTPVVSSLREATHLLASEPELSPAPPPEVQEVAELVVAEAEDIWFLDYSGTYSPADLEPEEITDEDRTFVTLDELSYRNSLTGNNCHAVTHEVHRALIESIGLPEGASASTVELVFESGVHWANHVTTESGERWVVDFTARQFDEGAEFPLIMEADCWQDWASTHVTSTHGGAFIEANWRD